MNWFKKESKALHTAFNVIGIVLCAILIPMLIVNITLIVKELTGSSIPSVGGIVPQIVLTGSMSPEIETGDLIFGKVTDPDKVVAGDVISFYDPSSKTDAIVTHRVVSVTEDEQGQGAWKTKGDANNTEDEATVPFKNLVAIYSGVRIPKAGNVAMFLQTSTGIIFSVLIPLMIFIIYDLIRRSVYEKKNKKDTDAMLAELEELRAQKAAQHELNTM